MWLAFMLHESCSMSHACSPLFVVADRYSPFCHSCCCHLTALFFVLCFPCPAPPDQLPPPQKPFLLSFLLSLFSFSLVGQTNTAWRYSVCYDESKVGFQFREGDTIKLRCCELCLRTAFSQMAAAQIVRKHSPVEVTAFTGMIVSNTQLGQLDCPLYYHAYCSDDPSPIHV
jgi:hypothetical protein